MNFTLPKYQDYKTWIKRARNRQIEWDDLMTARTGSEDSLRGFLLSRANDDFWPEISVEEWYGLVSFMKDEENALSSSEMEVVTMHEDDEDSTIEIPEDKKSCWQLYKKKLLNEKKYSQKNVDEIERASIKTLRCLSSNTNNRKPIKGLVIGNVQSGKTGNMAGLMALAADYGWNMFIVFSGVLENLRKQTENRLIKDLNNQRSNIHWSAIDHPRLGIIASERTSALHLNEGSRMSYLTVCLKNVTVIKKLIEWIQENGAQMQKMRILIIDDEADQASINTLSVEENDRTVINRLLCNLVGNKNIDGVDVPSKYHAMNYVQYTATPYANILNEGPSDESLYPSSFITTLISSKEYFGPQQIFGIDGGDYDGMDIIRSIDADEIGTIKAIHNGDEDVIPDTFIDSVCWFYCGVACMRYWGYRKAVSMLVHTSSRIVDHESIETSLTRWLSSLSKTDFINRCKSIWRSETNRFNKSKFSQQYPDYAISDENINDYPSFNDIRSELENLFEGDSLSKMQYDRSGSPIYNKKGVNLCVDNSVSDARIIYPESYEEFSKAPAFLVIGGQTLSRGLTFEGLICSYFPREVRQADTLMQMGRWFGYRRGYELLPRIWMSEVTHTNFNYLSELDQELRDEIREMAILGKRPSEFGPRVKNSPKKFRITALNRMQSASFTDMDFTGTFLQTYLVDNGIDIIRENLKATKKFLNSLQDPSSFNSCMSSDIVWKRVPFQVISRYLSQYKFNDRIKSLNDINPLLQWIDTMTERGIIGPWNVVLAGVGSEEWDNDTHKFKLDCGNSINKVNRSILKDYHDDGVYNFKAIRNSRDILADIDLDRITNDLKQQILHASTSQIKTLRSLAGLSETPQLIVYIIDKDSKADSDSQTRKDLNAPMDIAGLCINIPGAINAGGRATYVTIRINSSDNQNED